MSAHSLNLEDKRRKSPLIIRISYLEEIPAITKTYLFKYTENFTTKKKKKIFT